MATTYVFGAGASRHAGYPLASEMGEGLMRFMLDESKDDRSRPYAEYLLDQFGMPDDFEKFVTEVQSRIKVLRASKTEKDRTEYFKLGTRLAHLGESLREWFRKIHLGQASAYVVFAEQIIQCGDVVITFNYDDSLERELRRAGKWDVSDGYGFQLGDAPHSSDVQMLKLHGSINWLVSLFGGATSGVIALNSESTSLGDHPLIHRADLEFLGYEEFSGHTYRGGGAFPCLILPGRSKEFFYDTSLGQEYTEFWTGLWNQAISAVRRSDHILVCGYSMQAADQRACDLLVQESAKNARVSVVCGSQSSQIAARFETAGFLNVLALEGGHFEDWVQAEAERVR